MSSKMVKPKLYKGQPLKGMWLITIKLDGVRALRTEEGVVSRSGKPLYNTQCMPPKINDCEIFCGSWSETVSAVRTKDSEVIRSECFYNLGNLVDPRLIIDYVKDPTEDEIKWYLKEALAKGHEGLVLRQGDTWFKVKPEETHDVPVISIILGKGKYEGQLGALVTPMGNVGTGFSDKEREELLNLPIGTFVEVSCMELTKNSKFRNPRFKRVRWDK